MLFGRALQLEWRSRFDDKAVVEGPPFRRLFGVAVVYALLLPVLGLQEKAGCLMFSQLRLHGGSNHYLLPTSLLQRALIDAPPTNAFAGGVVRVCVDQKAPRHRSSVWTKKLPATARQNVPGIPGRRPEASLG